MKTNDQFMDEVRERLTQFMMENRISVNSISEQTNFSPSTLNNICNGRTKSPSLYTIYVACSLLDLSPIYLMQGTGPKSLTKSEATLQSKAGSIDGTQIGDAFNIGGTHTTTNNNANSAADQSRLVEMLTRQLETLQTHVAMQQQTITTLTDTNNKLTTRLLAYIK